MRHHKSSQGVVKLILANGGHLGMAQKRGVAHREEHLIAAFNHPSLSVKF
jgi:hypothetical protein